MITRLQNLSLNDLQPLLQEAEAEGFRFLKRLRDDWASGANRFDRDGESLYGYYVDRRLVAIGGITRQSPGCGRLRRFYVAKDFRRRGVGRVLVSHILAHATQFFDEAVLHTETASADAFYRATGFSRLAESNDITHRMELKRPKKVA
jgi:GNAT superfamily N-acetyltransferase